MLYLEDLAPMKCACGCGKEGGPIALHGKCHISAPTVAWYVDGMIRIECSVCKKLVAEIAVARRTKDNELH